jgi:DNA-binding beta-propeller fold protein YncE
MVRTPGAVVPALMIAEPESGGSAYDVPRMDANLGVGARVQLELEVPWRVATTPSGPARTLGNRSAAPMVTRMLLAAVLALVGCRAAAQVSRPTAEWRLIADLPLPGKPARFDYQTFDATAGWLWIAHMGAGEVLAVDVRRRQVVARVPNMPGVTGIRVVPALQRVFAALSGSHEVAVLDSRSGRVLARVPGGRFPDGLDYAPAANKLFVSDEYGRQELVIDLPSFTARRPIQVGGEVGNTQYDSVAGWIWVAVQTRNELVAIDPSTESVVKRIPVPGIERPHGFYVDAPRRLIYVTGEENSRIGVLNLRTKRIAHSYPVGDEPDVLAMDPERHRLFVAAESGTIAAFDVRGDSLVPLPRYTAARAHSVAVDPATHLVYVPLENSGGKAALRILSLE